MKEMLRPILVLILVFSTGCFPWEYVHGPSVSVGVQVVDHGTKETGTKIEISPVFGAGYRLMYMDGSFWHRSWGEGVGFRTELAYAPLENELRLRALGVVCVTLLCIGQGGGLELIDGHIYAGLAFDLSLAPFFVAAHPSKRLPAYIHDHPTDYPRGMLDAAGSLDAYFGGGTRSIGTFNVTGTYSLHPRAGTSDPIPPPMDTRQ